MSQEKRGMGAEVGARKINGDGEVVQEEGAIERSASKFSWAIFIGMVILSVFGIWKVIEIVSVFV